MSFEKNAFGSFVRDMGKVVFSGPERAKQPEPVKRPLQNVWGNRSFVRKDQFVKKFGKESQKIVLGSDGKKIRLDSDKRLEQVDKLFGNRNTLTRAEAQKRVRLMHKEARVERMRGIQPSKRAETMEIEKLANEFNPVGSREVKPKPEGILSGTLRGFKNSIRMARGGEPVLPNPPQVDASVINQNIPDIKQ
jgi:hypothetical protein